MADRKRSDSGSRETEKYTPKSPKPDQSGRSDGDLQRDAGTRDEKEKIRRGGGGAPAGVRKGDDTAED